MDRGVLLDCPQRFVPLAVTLLCWLFLAPNAQAQTVSANKESLASTHRSDSAYDHHPVPWSGTYEKDYERGFELFRRLVDSRSANLDAQGKNLPRSTEQDDSALDDSTIGKQPGDKASGISIDQNSAEFGPWLMAIAGLVFCLGISVIASRFLAPKINTATAHQVDLEQTAAELETKIAMVQGRHNKKPAPSTASAQNIQSSKAVPATQDEEERILTEKNERRKPSISLVNEVKTQPLSAVGEETEKLRLKEVPDAPPGIIEQTHKDKPSEQAGQSVVQKAQGLTNTKEQEHDKPLFALADAAETKQPAAGEVEPTKTTAENATDRPSRTVGDAAKQEPSEETSPAVSPQVIQLIEDFEDLVDMTEDALKRRAFGQSSQTSIIKAIEKATKLIKSAYTRYSVEPGSEQHFTKAIKKATRVITNAIEENMDEESARLGST